MPGPNDLVRLRTHEAVHFLNSHRIFFYALVSLVSVSAVITNALKNYSNFYSVAIYLSKSSRSVLVLANFGVLLTLLCGHVVQRIFFGSLRANEVERLYDRLWFFITESLLAFTIFRDEFDMPFALMFGFLLFVKSFHWLASDRIEWMDQRPYPGPPLLFHFRMTILFGILWSTDCIMFLFAVEHTLSAGVGGMVLFASEYAILMASVMNTISKYLLSAYDLRRAGRRGGENAPPWENKSMWVFYIELVTDFLKLTTYLVFFIIIITFYGLPLNIIRDVYITARSFVTRLRALHRYQTATRNMDQRYPNATDEELAATSDRTCIICREEMVSPVAQGPVAPTDGPNTTPKKLPCGHIFHFYCLRSWLERQQSCPTCRRNVLDDSASPPQPVPGGLPGQNIQAGPQQPNQPVIAQNLQNGNNQLGLIGRLFGPPGRLGNPIVNRAPAQNVHNNQAQAGQQPGIVINYQVQYQFPRQQNEDNIQTAQQLQQRAPVPPYNGFPGPRGAWQEWPAQGDLPNAVPDPVEGGPAVQAATTSEEGDASPAPHTSTTSSSSQASETSAEGQDGDLSPREAAARAAFSRYTNKPVTTLPEDSSIAQTQEPRTSAPSSNCATSSTPEAVSKSINHIPKLIPLLDFQAPASTPHPHVQRQGPIEVNGRPSSTPFAQTARPVAPQNKFTHYSSNTTVLPTQSSSVPSFQLPPTLTDEQLATLDTLTRESIDERLRILEGVSSTVYRCMDELMRLRSALPPTNFPTGSSSSTTRPSETVASSTTTLESSVVPITERGREKMKATESEEAQDSGSCQDNQTPASSTSTDDEVSSM
ncbi:hypothetical protein NLJ89_g61 [Agrocybe chaxingu]|uniref:RING-type E3 ubiquitin transferase n=1 Tax=Agrocybe chaxingu TaxID=84603 RepID=A0A9W8TFN7_9AGAR|nr:hypothetical protein NLJ89_g61 [Agrocybe chaxingu]